MLRVLLAAGFIAATVPALAQDQQAPAPPQSHCDSATASWWSKLFGPGEIALGVEVRAVEVTSPAEPAEEGDAPCVCGDVLHSMGDCPCFALFERMVAATEVQDTNEDGETCRNRLSLGVIPPPFHVLMGDAAGIPVRIGFEMAPDELPHPPQTVTWTTQPDGTTIAECARHVDCCEGGNCPETCCQDECAKSGCCALACPGDAVCGSACGTAVCQQGCPVICGVPNEDCQQTRSFVIALTAKPKCGAASCKCADCKCSGTECAGPTSGAWCVVTYSTVNGQFDSASGSLVAAGDKWVVVREDNQRECWIPADNVITVRTQPASGPQQYTRHYVPQQHPQPVPPQVAWRGPHQIIFAAPTTGTWQAGPAPHAPPTSPVHTWQALPAPREAMIQIPLTPPTASAPSTALPPIPTSASPYRSASPYEAPSSQSFYPVVPPAPPLMPTTPSERPIYTPAPPAPPAAYPATSQRAEAEDIESLTCSSSACAVAAPHVCETGRCAACPTSMAKSSHAPAQYVISISRFNHEGDCNQQSHMVTIGGRTAWLNVANFGIGVRVDSPLEEGGPLRLAAYNPTSGHKPLAVADVRLGDGLKLKWPTQHSKMAETVQIDVGTLQPAPAHAVVLPNPIMPPPATTQPVPPAYAPPQPAPSQPAPSQTTSHIGRFFGIHAESIPAKPMQVQVYSVAEFIASPPSGSPIAVVGGVAQRTPSFKPLVDLIQTQVEPASWREGGAVIHPFPQNYSLVIRQTAEGHEQISDLFDQLRKLKFDEARISRTPDSPPPAAESDIDE